MTDLIEDDDGAPFPMCIHCPDQVAPPGTGSNPANWAHVFASPEHDRRWYLNNCQQPTVGRYGEFMADPGEEIRNRHSAGSTDITEEG